MMDENSAGCASEAARIEDDIMAAVLAVGRAECGQTFAHDADGHADHIRESVKITAAHFGQTGPQHMHGLYLEGTGIVLCHTGTSPNSPQHARVLTGAWNWLVERCEAQTATLPAPTISQNVPAPAAVTAEMVRDACIRSGLMHFYPHLDPLTAHLNAALSAATPLQSDLAADNARLREALKVFADAANAADDPADGYLDRHDLWESPIAMQVTVGDLRLARAALQGADNHE